MSLKTLIVILVLFGAALFVFVMEFFPSLREWIALGLVILMDGAIVGAFVRHQRQPERYLPPPLIPATAVILFSLLFYCVFISWLTGGR